MEHTEFMKELSSLLNRACCENVSNTPDFILAEYMQSCLVAYDAATIKRDKWYNVSLVPGSSHFIEQAPGK